jgi:hypothetical protein
MRSGRVLAHAYYLIACTLQFAIVVAQATSLSRTATGIILRIEVQYQLSSLVITQTDVPSLFVLAQNLGRLVSNVHSQYALDDVAKVSNLFDNPENPPPYFII